MGLKWSAGAPAVLAARIKVRGEEFRGHAADITERAADSGAVLQRELLDRAETEYGQRRYAAGRGGSAGRNDTGEMINDIESRTTRSKTQVTGEWGWLDNHEDYYQYQDDGTGRIPPAHSLLDSFLVTREQWFKDLKDLT